MRHVPRFAAKQIRMQTIPIYFIVTATDGVRTFRLAYTINEIYAGSNGICVGLRKEFNGPLLNNLLTNLGLAYPVLIDSEVTHTIKRVSSRTYDEYINR